MAARSPGQWPSNRACTVSLNSSNFPHYCHSNRYRIIPWSTNFHSSPYACCAARNNGKKSLRKSVEPINVIDDLQIKDPDISSVNGEFSGLNKGQSLSFKSLFGRQALWRRIFFASKKVRGILLLNVITVIYASNIPIVKEVESIVDPEAFTVVRFAVAAIPFIPFVLQARDDAKTRKAGLELGFWVSLGYIMQALGLLTSDAGRAAFLTMFTVIVVPLIDGMFGSTIPIVTWFGALMSIIGVGLLESSGSPPCIGDLLNFSSAVFFGIHMLRTERISRNNSKNNFLPILGYEICTVALLSAIWYAMETLFVGGIKESDISSLTWATFWHSIAAFPWIPALYTGIFSTSLCLWVELAAMSDVSATEAAIIYGLEPVWGAGFAWLLLGERWGINGWIGAALVIGGSLTVQILGASSNSAREYKNNNTKTTDTLISEDENDFSTSPVAVNARKEPQKLLKK